MTSTIRQTTRALIAAAALATGLAAMTAVAAPQARVAAQAQDENADMIDLVIMRDGRTVRGEILEETPTKVRMIVHVKVGDIEQKVETTYDRKDILEIKHDAEAAGESAPAKANTPAKAADSSLSASTSKIYMATMKGELGRDVSRTPMEDILRDAKNEQPDFLVFKVDTDYSFMGREAKDWDPSKANQAFAQLETVRELQTMFTDEIANDPEWRTRSGGKPRLVFWVDKALGGSAFLPFLSEDVYYTSKGRQGGMGYLEYIFGQTGDEVVREKQFSLRLGRAEGLAIKGGHDPRLIRAMARADYVLSVKFEGGRPVFYEGMPGEGDIPSDAILLTDDANEQAGRADFAEDVLRFRGNDVLTLDHEMAKRLGVSKGTADTESDLAFELGVSRDYILTEGKSERIFDDWAKAVTDAERQFRRLWRDFGRLQVEQPGGYDERTKFRGQQLQILRQVKSLLARYKEAINPNEIQGAPDQWDSQINIMIDQIEQQQRLDRRD